MVERAAAKIQSYFVRERLLEHASAIEAYQKGGMVKAEIDGILAAEFCQALLAPVVEAYQDERRGYWEVREKWESRKKTGIYGGSCWDCTWIGSLNRGFSRDLLIFVICGDREEWNSHLLESLQEKKGSRVELAPTEEVDGERAGGAYYFVSISEILR